MAAHYGYRYLHWSRCDQGIAEHWSTFQKKVKMIHVTRCVKISDECDLWLDTASFLCWEDGHWDQSIQSCSLRGSGNPFKKEPVQNKPRTIQPNLYPLIISTLQMKAECILCEKIVQIEVIEITLKKTLGGLVVRTSKTIEMQSLLLKLLLTIPFSFEY